MKSNALPNPDARPLESPTVPPRLVLVVDPAMLTPRQIDVLRQNGAMFATLRA